MQHKFCCVNLICRSWRAWWMNQINNNHKPFLDVKGVWYRAHEQGSTTLRPNPQATASLPSTCKSCAFSYCERMFEMGERRRFHTARWDNFWRLGEVEVDTTRHALSAMLVSHSGGLTQCERTPTAVGHLDLRHAHSEADFDHVRVSYSPPTLASVGHQWTVRTNRGPLLELVYPVRATGCNQCWYSPFSGGPHQ